MYCPCNTLPTSIWNAVNVVVVTLMSVAHVDNANHLRFCRSAGNCLCKLGAETVRSLVTDLRQFIHSKPYLQLKDPSIA